MAIWQYRFIILPEENICVENFLSETDEKGFFDDSYYWKQKRMHISYFREISKILAVNDSWNKDILLFGSEQSNCIEIYNEMGNIISISFRIDLMSDYYLILKKLVSFFSEKKLILVDEELNVLLPIFEKVKLFIERIKSQRC